jgi:hypothetical protein
VRLTLDDYLMGRASLYNCPQETKANSADTVEKVNSLLAVLEEQKVPLEIHPKTLTIISSGWRPPEMNARIKNAAVKSKHITGQACDLYDPEGLIDDYLMDFPGVLQAIGLYMEHPASTKGWSHVQTVPPRSGRRVFYP